MNDKFNELPGEKQMAVLNAALKTFALMGYKKASTQDIAREAAISKSLLFHYFDTKIGLFSYTFNYAVDTVSKSLQDFKYTEKEDLFEMIERANIIKIKVYKDHHYLYKFIYQSYFEEDPQALAIVRARNDDLIANNYENVLNHMDASKLREGIQTEKMLQIILWVSEGFLQSKLNARDIDPDKLLVDFNEWMRTLKICFYKS